MTGNLDGSLDASGGGKVHSAKSLCPLLLLLVLAMATFLAGCGPAEAPPPPVEGSIAWDTLDLPTGDFPSHVWSLAVDPRDSALWYAGTWDGKFFRTTNSGGDWVLLQQWPSSNPVHVIAASTVVTTDLFAGGDDGLYFSDNLGRTWKPAGGLVEKPVYALAQHPAVPEVMYAGTGEGVFISADAGRNWMPATEGPGGYVWCLHVTADGQAYAGTDSGLFHKSEGTWRLAGAIPEVTSIRALVADPTDATRLYLGTGRGAVLEFDTRSGAVRDLSLFVSGPISSLDMPADPGGLLFAASDGSGIHRYDLQSGEWTALPVPATHIRYLDVLPPGGTSVVAGSWESGVLHSEDRGASWTLRNQGLATASIQSFAIDPAKQVLYAGSDSGLYRSPDQGRTWTLVEDTEGSHVTRTAVHPAEPDLVYYADVAGSFRRSRDGGQTWTGILTGTFLSDFALHPRDPDTIVVATRDSGVSRSTDGGDTWQEASQGLATWSMRFIAFDSGDPNVLFAAGAAGLYMSTNGGLDWSHIEVQDLQEPLALTFYDPLASDLMFLGTSKGLYRSEDRGHAWHLTGTEVISDSRVSSFAVDPSGIVYAGTERGVFWSGDGGLTWRDGNGAGGVLSNASIDALAVQETEVGTYLYAASSSFPQSMDLEQQCVQLHNLGANTADVTIHFLDSLGVSAYQHAFTIPPNGLYTMCMDDLAGLPEGMFSPFAEATEPIESRVVASTGAALRTSGAWRGASSLLALPQQEPGLAWAWALGFASLAVVAGAAAAVYWQRVLVPRQIERARAGELDIWLREIDARLEEVGHASRQNLKTVPKHSYTFALQSYMQAHLGTALVLTSGPGLKLRHGSQINAIKASLEAARKAVAEGNHTRFLSASYDMVAGLARFLGVEIEPAVSSRQVQVYTVEASSILYAINLPSRLAVLHPASQEFDARTLDDVRAILLQHKAVADLPTILISNGERDLGQVQETIDLQLNKLYSYSISALDRPALHQVLASKNPEQAVRSLILDHVDLVAISPYGIHGPTPENMFFGREIELHQMAQHLGTRTFGLVGGRRIGKTSLLLRLHRDRLPAAGFCTVYHDCATVASYEEFVAAPIHNWQPEPPAGAPATLAELLAAPPGDVPLVLLLDEADKLLPSDRARGWPLFNALRSLSNAGAAQFVLSGERTLQEALGDPRSPLFNVAQRVLLGPLEFRAVEELVTLPMKQLEIELAGRDAIVQLIWDLTSGHPNVVQRICHRLIERLNRQGARRITLDDLKAIVEHPDFQREDFLSTYWESATPLERIISLLMADDEEVRTLSGVREALARHCEISPGAREVDAALQRLVDLRSILRSTPDGYDFAVGAFPRVVAGTMTLQDMLDILAEEYAEHVP